MEDNHIDRNTLTLVGLAKEYCTTLENAGNYSTPEFVEQMVRLLPRIYITMTDARPPVPLQEDYYSYSTNYVEEDYYDSIRRNVGMLLGPDDVFLETFEEDMKYSDSPIAASVSECLTDIFQDLFNFLAVVKNSEGADIETALRDCKDNFNQYWAQILCNVMRPLNKLRMGTE